jgi:hypothetical protein
LHRLSIIMPTNVDDIIRKLGPVQRKKVEARAAELIAEEMTLRELRHARKLTRVGWPRSSESHRTVFRGRDVISTHSFFESPIVLLSTEPKVLMALKRTGRPSS